MGINVFKFDGATINLLKFCRATIWTLIASNLMGLPYGH